MNQKQINKQGLHRKPVFVYAVICPYCHDTIYSRARHDMRFCSCEQTSIDGGFNYMKIGCIGITPISILLCVHATRRELYDDWNRSYDKYGHHKNCVEPLNVT